jgi:hypothetical protein
VEIATGGKIHLQLIQLLSLITEKAALRRAAFSVCMQEIFLSVLTKKNIFEKELNETINFPDMALMPLKENTG